MKRVSRAAMGFLFSILATGACANTADELQSDTAELGGTGPRNCVAMCVLEARLCRQEGDPPAVCSADLEECKARCREDTCEESPDCPGGE